MQKLFKAVLSISLLFASPGTVLADNNNCNTSSVCCSCNGPCTGSCGACFDSCSFDDCSSCCESEVKTFINFRSVGANTARELVGWQWELNRPFMCENYGAFYIAYEYQRSFKPERITNQLFGCSTLRFSGSQVPNRCAGDLLADNFGLSQNFVGSVTFRPQIVNNIVDLGFYMGLDCWLQNSYLRIHMPIANTRWTLCPCECVQTTSPAIPSCYVNSSSTDSLFSDVSPTPAIQSLQTALLGTTAFGDKKDDWCGARIDFCRRTRTRLADIDLIFGYNFLNNDCAHFGLYAQLVLPTGGKPNSLYLFNPYVGNGGHVELGVGVSAHSVIWGCETQNLAIFLEGNVTHMFQNKQCRVFDLCNNGPFSRYLLLKEFDSNGVVNTYNGNLVSATCFTNRLANVKVDIKGDVSVKLAYRWCGWGFDLGYNIYGHSREKIYLPCNTDCCGDDRKFAIKGTEGVCCAQYPIVSRVDDGVDNLYLVPNNTPVNTGFGDFTVPAGCPDLPNNLATVQRVINSATQPNATACNGAPLASNGAVSNCNPIPDSTLTQCCNVALAYNSPEVTTPTIIGTVPATAETISTNLVNEGFILCNNNSPVTFLSDKDLNINSAEAVSVLTQKIFAHFNYTCYDECGWNPHIGIGGEVEFDGNRPNRFFCKPTNLNQWGVWVKGGVSF